MATNTRSKVPSSNTPSNLSDVDRVTSNFHNLNINGATLSSAAHVFSDSDDDGGAQYGGQQHQGSSKGGGNGNTNNNGHKHRRRQSIVRSSGPADELGLLVEEVQQAAEGITVRPKGKAGGR
ncbi:hypothetical protein FS837_004667 [Tulasnella sp. UAMH 9824]|nr:hypothetical protein FS837_004667 [Tulasnella sp. UAMH 9824]